MGQDYLYVFTAQVHRRIERLFGKIVGHNVQQTVFGNVGSPVEVDCQTLVQITVVLDHLLYVFHIETELAEHIRVRGETHEGPVLFFCSNILSISDFRFEPTSLETCARHLPVPVGLYVKAL